MNNEKQQGTPIVLRPIEIAAEYSALAILRTGCAVKHIRRAVADSVDAVMLRDPAATGRAEVLLLYSGVHAILLHRVASHEYKNGHTFRARAISQFARFLTGIEIHPGATIGKGLVIDHGSGIVIGETAEIGDNCTIYQGVTLGGTGKDVGKRHPTIGNSVLVGAGAKVLGPVKIGDNVKIAAGAVVLDDIPDNSTAVGIPAKVVRKNGEKIDNTELDQIHIPDPVMQEMLKLSERIALLEADAEKRKRRSRKKPAEPAEAPNE